MKIALRGDGSGLGGGVCHGSRSEEASCGELGVVAVCPPSLFESKEGTVHRDGGLPGNEMEGM